MTEERRAPAGGQSHFGPLQWNVALRALREARGVTQEGWAALLGVGRTTLQRWESGRTPPDLRAEEAIIRVCREQGLLRSYGSGPFQGRSITADLLQELLAEARLGAEVPIGGQLGAAPTGQLIESPGEHEGRRHDLRFPVTEVGRSLDNDVVIEHPRVSRHHARVSWEGTAYVLYDLESTNGTFLNGTRVTMPAPLRDGDAIQLGGLETPRLLIYLPNEAVTTIGGAESIPE